jgi:hypothetical protein
MKGGWSRQGQRGRGFGATADFGWGTSTPRRWRHHPAPGLLAHRDLCAAGFRASVGGSMGPGPVVARGLPRPGPHKSNGGGGGGRGLCRPVGTSCSIVISSRANKSQKSSTSTDPKALHAIASRALASRGQQAGGQRAPPIGGGGGLAHHTTCFSRSQALRTRGWTARASAGTARGRIGLLLAGQGSWTPAPCSPTAGWLGRCPSQASPTSSAAARSGWQTMQEPARGPRGHVSTHPIATTSTHMCLKMLNASDT